VGSGNIIGKNEVELLRFPSYVADAHNEYVIESHPEYGKDTTGAGDAFASGFLYGLVKGKGLEECGRLGNITAQFSITEIGAREGLPTVDELAQRYQELYSQQL
jgi:ribokinase